MGRILMGALVGGIVLFMWQWAAWMFLGIHDVEPEPLLANESAVIEVLEGTDKGVYWIPGHTRDLDMASAEGEAWQERHKAGPRAFLIYDPEGAEMMDPKTMGFGALFCILTAFVICLMLRGAGIGSFLGRWLMVIGIGVILAIAIDLQNWNWQNFTLSWTQGYIIDRLAGFALVGFFLALIVKPAAPALD